MTDNTVAQRLSIIGVGKIGRPIGRHWLAAGHTVTFGSRSPQRLAPVISEFGGAAGVATPAQAVEAGDVVLLAVPNDALEDVIGELGDRLDGKVVIDATNPFALSSQGHIVSTLRSGLTEGRSLATRLPRSTVARAFTHVMEELLWSRGTTQRLFWAIAIAGDDTDAKRMVSALVRDTGFVPVDLGGLDDSAALDPGGELFPHMFTEAEMRHVAGIPA